MAPQGRMRGEFAAASRLWGIMANLPLISQRAGPLTAFPVGEAKPNKNAPLQTTAGREMLFMRFYLDAQAEQLAQEAQSGCSSTQMRSADGVHWSA